MRLVRLEIQFILWEVCLFGFLVAFEFVGGVVWATPGDMQYLLQALRSVITPGRAQRIICCGGDGTWFIASPSLRRLFGSLGPQRKRGCPEGSSSLCVDESLYLLVQRIEGPLSKTQGEVRFATQAKSPAPSSPWGLARYIQYIKGHRNSRATGRQRNRAHPGQEPSICGDTSWRGSSKTGLCIRRHVLRLHSGELWLREGMQGSPASNRAGSGFWELRASCGHSSWGLVPRVEGVRGGAVGSGEACSRGGLSAEPPQSRALPGTPGRSVVCSRNRRATAASHGDASARARAAAIATLR